jgi:hypothetical protein
MLQGKTKSFIAAIALALVMSLVWTLSTQDLCDIYNVDASVDLPEMAAVDAPDLDVLPDVTPEPPPPPVRLITNLARPRAPSIVKRKRCAAVTPCAPPLHWLANNPKTASPLV